MKQLANMKHHIKTFLLCLTLTTTGAMAQEQQNWLPDGTYYIQNKASGTFISAGAYWGCWGVLREHGIDFAVTRSGDTYTLTSRINGSSKMLNSTNGYVDGDQGTWQLAALPDGTYAMYSPSKQRYYGYMPDDAHPYMLNIDTYTDTESDNTHWRFLTREQLAATLDAATRDNPVDATFFITAPDFLYEDRRITSDKCWGTDLTKTDGMRAEKNTMLNTHNGEQFNKAAFNVTQTLTGIPNGVYKLTMQGFYRNGDNGPSATAHNNQTEELLVVLYAGNKSTPLRSIYSEAQQQQNASSFNLSTDAGYIPDRQWYAAQCFTDGYYLNTLEEIVVTDNTLTIGVRKENKAVTNDWTVFDNFTLLYLGVDLSILQERYDAQLAAAKALQICNMQASVKVQLDAAVSAAETDVNRNSQTWLEAQVTALTAAIESAQHSISIYEGGTILAAVNGMKAQSASEAVCNELQFEEAIAQPELGSHKGQRIAGGF